MAFEGRRSSGLHTPRHGDPGADTGLGICSDLDDVLKGQADVEQDRLAS